MGTSLTAGQASLMRRFTRKCVIAYDGDSAGRAAVLRVAPVLLAAGLDVLALDLLGAKDPDEIRAFVRAARAADAALHRVASRA